MNRSLALFLIGLIFGGGIGFIAALSSGASLSGHDHSDPAQHGAGTDHAAHAMQDGGLDHDSPREVAQRPAPEVQIMVHPDPMAGHNLHVMIEHFAFAPQQASLAHVNGQGHAHVYVNGQKRGRIYGAWVHLADLPKGEVTIDVSLNANDHRPLAVDGKPIRASARVQIE